MSKQTPTFTSEMTPREMRTLVRVSVPSCTSPRKHVRQALTNDGKVTPCTHKLGKRVPA